MTSPAGSFTPEPAVRFLLSLDIDGTLETGDPPGPLTLAAVAAARRLGHVVGTSSDRTLAEQRAMWARARLGYDFVCRKHQMASLAGEFACDRYLHIGDTEWDGQCAAEAGFEFRHISDLVAGAPYPWQHEEGKTDA
jgi:hypothetical protein